jgi:hypothetical protein
MLAVAFEVLVSHDRDLPAPAYVLARAAWIPTLEIWHADGCFTRLEGDPCEDYAAARAASWRLRPTPRDREPLCSTRSAASRA